MNEDRASKTDPPFLSTFFRLVWLVDDGVESEPSGWNAQPIPWKTWWISSSLTYFDLTKNRNILKQLLGYTKKTWRNISKSKADVFQVGMQDFTFQVELHRTPQAARLGVDLIVAKTGNDGCLDESTESTWKFAEDK